MDGDKRTAFVTAALFLEINDFSLDPDQEEVVINMVKSAVDEITEEQFAEWLKDNCRKMRRSSK